MSADGAPCKGEADDVINGFWVYMPVLSADLFSVNITVSVELLYTELKRGNLVCRVAPQTIIPIVWNVWKRL